MISSPFCVPASKNFKDWIVGAFACSSSFYLLFLAQPPSEFPETAYFFLLPILIWFSFKPDNKIVITNLFFFGTLFHISLFGWIRHVTPIGMIAASIIVTLYHMPWFFLVCRWIPLGINSNFYVRVTLILGLSSFWVIIEWLRSLFPLGFPWCPLSVSQWQRPAILQLVPVFGAWVVSFFLIFFNFSLASYVHHLFVRRRLRANNSYFSSLCPEFYLCMLFFLGMLSPLLLNFQQRKAVNDFSIKVGVCQPYLIDKWKAENVSTNKRKLIEQTKILATLGPDLIVWPEASTPYPVNLDRSWVEKLSSETGIPILAGTIIKEGGLSFNSVVLIRPNSGLESDSYAKEILVPFGEYVPFPFNYFNGITRLVGPVGNFTSGQKSLNFKIQNSSNETVSFMPLICYEDIFPNKCLKKNITEHSILFVTTNDAWFGEEGCAEQHASHSVLRSLETGVPVLRCGNAGWSGWISPSGVVQETLLNEEDSVYFQGASVLNIDFGPNKETIYHKYGNFFVALCAFFLIMASFSLREKRNSNVNL